MKTPRKKSPALHTMDIRNSFMLELEIDETPWFGQKLQDFECHQEVHDSPCPFGLEIQWFLAVFSEGPIQANKHHDVANGMAVILDGGRMAQRGHVGEVVKGVRDTVSSEKDPGHEVHREGNGHEEQRSRAREAVVGLRAIRSRK